MNEPVFSIIIPAYNCASYLANTVAVIALQCTAADEILLIDDCSEDTSWTVIQSLAKAVPQVRALRTEENGGPGHARNLGIEHAQGQWLVFIDSDDTPADGMLSTIRQQLGEYAIKPDIVSFNWCYDKKSDAAIYGYEGRDDLELLATASGSELLQAYCRNQIDSSVIYSVFRADWLKQLGLKFRKGLHEDVDFMFIALMHAQIQAVIEQPLYLKNNRNTSIVNSLTAAHIYGYFAGLERMYDALQQLEYGNHCDDAFIDGLINVAASRLVRLQRMGDDLTVWQPIITALHEVLKPWNPILNDSLKKTDGKFRTKYQQIVSFFLELQGEKAELQELKQFLDEIQPKSWSCFDLHQSVFLAPDEIRTCCKRFFHDGELKGDVVLLKEEAQNTDTVFSYDEIKTAKADLYREINRDNSDACRGCPFLEFKDWQGQPLSQGIGYLSFEYHSVCNMKCSYCSETYYGGEKVHYDIAALTDSMLVNGALDNNEYIVWGGGEPLLDKQFDTILATISAQVPTVKQRVITNATRFSEPLAVLMEADRAYIVTSIDAGRDETFKQIRQYNRMDKVYKNLRAYAERAASNVIIKYIFLPENRSFEELSGFVELIKDNQLQACNFQISFDFKEEQLPFEDLSAMVVLYSLLTQAGVRLIFFDDLIMQRLEPLSRADMSVLQQLLADHGLPDVLSKEAVGREVVVWGTGAQTRLLLEKCQFFSERDIACFIDPRPHRIGQSFMGKVIKAPSSLLESDLPVVIAAVQSAPQIYSQYQALGLPASRLVRQLVI